MIPVARLRGLAAFEGASEEALAALAATGRLLRFSAGEVLFLEGSQPRGWWVLLEGRVRVVRGSGGRQHVIHTEEPGGTLGEVPLFTEGTHPATAIAMDAVSCALFDRAAIERAIRRQPSTAFLLLRRLALRVHRLVDRLDQRSARSVQSRLADFLLALSPGTGTAAVHVGMTQTELAEELGTVREVVARELRLLRRRGLLVPAGRGRYRLPDREALGRLRE